MKNSFLVKYHHDIPESSIKVKISVDQNSHTLYNRTIDLQCYLSPLLIEFRFDALSEVKLIFETECELIRGNPFYVDRIVLDEMFDFPHVPHRGVLLTDTQETGNCLYAPGKLVYSFALPFVSNFREYSE